MAREKPRVVPGPPNPVVAPRGIEGQGCEIVFGHNADIRKVLMQFSVTCDRLLFSPEEAHDVASKLIQFAELARGSQKAS